MEIEIIPPAAPVVKQGSVIVYDSGDISRGLYYYTVTAVTHTESNSSHIIQVYARHKRNSIFLAWEPVPDVEEYRVYRGTSPDQFDGFFSVAGNSFCDTGFGVLNEQQLNPPYGY